MSLFCQSCLINDSSDSVTQPVNICKVCGEAGLPVRSITLQNIVNKNIIENMETLENFYFCKSPDCDTIYFNNSKDIYLNKNDVKIRVGIKETTPPVPICYCFEINKEDLYTEIKKEGDSKAVKFIEDKIKNGECSCETKNPSGRCCINDVRKTVNYLKTIID